MHREAAEDVRAHLVALRGGAPFLSPTDAQLLLEWLDEGVPVEQILRALERAAEARRKKRSRIPLRLSHAKRHLGKATRGFFARKKIVSDGSLAPLVARLRDRAGDDARADELAALADELAQVEGEPDQVMRKALAAARAFHDHGWRSLSSSERSDRLEAAMTELGDLVELMDERAVQAAAEELARDTLRQRYPELDAAALWDLLFGEDR